MKESVFDILNERGFIQQCTNEEKVKEILDNEKISFYIGFDPTADSLHIGHFLTIMVMSHLQKHGHKPIALVGGGTGMIGDPTDRTDMRKMMTLDEIKSNAGKFKTQLSKFIDFSDDKAIMVDNADWLLNLEYIPFLREYGVHFSVNRMLTADSYKTRLEKGLSFLEFNYMIMQAYDFLELNRRHNCVLQLGGNDQWSNIIAGIELLRRVDSKEGYGLTLTLLTTSDNKKMGKTQQGAVWLDPQKTSPYDFYQYWRNIEDASVIKCLKLLTFLPMNEIEVLAKLEGSEINKAKEVLAFEITKMVHNEEEAEKAKQAALALFSGASASGSIPESELSKSEFVDSGINIIDLLEKTQVISSRGNGRRLIQQGGIKINESKIDSIDYIVSLESFSEGSIMVQKGKKTFLKVILKD